MLRHDLVHTAVAFGPSLLFIVLFPPMIGLALAAGKQRRAAQRQRIEAYRASEASHLLKLR